MSFDNVTQSLQALPLESPRYELPTNFELLRLGCISLRHVRGPIMQNPKRRPRNVICLLPNLEELNEEVPDRIPEVFLQTRPKLD